MFSIIWVLEVATKVADVCVSRFVDADKHHLPRHPLAPHLKVEHRGHGHRRRHAYNRRSPGAFDLLHVPFWILKAAERVALKHDVGENSVDAGLHLVREAGHHGIHDDHRCHAERHADNARQRDPTRAEITPAKQEFIHWML